jgi:threonine dehydrogenase-like Zn-dependent dehydrogenase
MMIINATSKWWSGTGSRLIKELLPDVREGRIERGQVFNRVIGLEEVPAGYRVMDERESTKIMIET